MMTEYGRVIVSEEAAKGQGEACDRTRGKTGDEPERRKGCTRGQKLARSREGTHAQMIVLEKKIIIMGDANLILGVNWKRVVDGKG